MQTLLDASGIVKSFSGTTVLGDGRLDVAVGEIHALMGANGAGKSTLLKILTGVYSRDAGDILLTEPGSGTLRPIEVGDPREASRLGIAIVHQELILSDNLTVADNISLGDEPTKWGQVLDGKAAIARARDALALVGARIDPRREVGSLSTAEKQLVEIAKALSKDARLLILDEPTTSLTDSEAKRLFEVLERLRASGIAIVYVSHRMEEIFALSDRITVMRDGRYVDTLTTAETSRDDLIRLMIGRTLAAEFAGGHDSEHGVGEEVLKLDGLASAVLPGGVSLAVRRGEIAGMFGLVGAGRTELARAVFGIDKVTGGRVSVAGKTLTRATPSRAIGAGIGLVPEDRKECGLVLDESIVHNMELAALRDTGFVQWTSRRAKALWASFSTSLGIVARGPEQPVGTLSGGNQQKVVLAKWLALDPTVLILDEPTRGVDVGAKEDIYTIIRDLAKGGAGVLVISSEIEEVLMISDRVIVMREGEITLDAENDGLDRHILLSRAMGEAA